MSENWLLGILMMLRSAMRMRVERSPMCMTVPVLFPKRQTSPTSTGRSPITEMPPEEVLDGLLCCQDEAKFSRASPLRYPGETVWRRPMPIRNAAESNFYSCVLIARRAWPEFKERESIFHLFCKFFSNNNNC